MNRYGFSRTTGVLSITVYGFAGQVPSGGLVVPTKTMFQFPPRQLPHSALRENHCCCEPEFTWPSILQSAMNPPLDQPPSERIRFPFTCVRRSAVPCETAHTLTFSSRVGVTERFSTHRQKLQVALLFRIHFALDRTAPLM